ncbi:MAG: SDR family NAD(P)-dependent oxidoreductase [Proteobacteria bacterium]|nr:SDR family NAD(P)-dependent oxidoreductase [Pseudomonadota bacterium]
MKIRDNIAVVAGGGSGMGAAVCRYLAEEGAKIIVIDKSENAATHIAEETHGLAIACDITKSEALEKAFDKIAKAHVRPISIAINCAGIAPAKRMVGKEGPMPLSFFEEVINVNLIGTFNVMRLAASTMMKSEITQEGERGVIINTASIAAFEGQIGQTAYSASKAGIIGMMLPAARELAKFGIRVMTVAPGLVNTPMLQGMPEEIKASLAAQSLFPKRFAEPEEFAALVGQIITNPMLNAEVIRLDGGMRMI